MSIKIIVFITPSEKFYKEISGFFVELKEKTLLENGCFQFDIYKHEKDYVLIEEWRSQEAIDIHMEKEYTKNFIEKTKDKIIKTLAHRLKDL